jgi:ribonuclease BN (tRNA processing enzyme)
MKLKILGSGSAGNCYILESSKGERLILDLGVKWKEIQQALNFDYSNVSALLTHSHSDHSRSLVKASNCFDCYLSGESMDEVLDSRIGKIGDMSSGIMYLDPGYVSKIMGYSVIAFDLFHNVPCQGYFVHHPEMGKLIYITDTCKINHDFNEVNWWLIESNFCEDTILKFAHEGSSDTGRLLDVIDRHLSVQKCEEYLRSQDLTDTEGICLLHLSDRNSHSKQFKERIERATGVPTCIAEAGLEINLNVI